MGIAEQVDSSNDGIKSRANLGRKENLRDHSDSFLGQMTSVFGYPIRIRS
jgi:hypothetical protein